MIRAATLDDTAAIRAIYNYFIDGTTVTFLHDRKSDVEIAEMITSSEGVLVDDDGGVRGFARYFPFRTGAGYRLTVEHTIMFAPGMAGQGRGRALLEALCDRARANGKHVMIASVAGENQAGLAFHAACGFAKVATLPEVGEKFGRYLDAIFMQRML